MLRLVVMLAAVVSCVALQPVIRARAPTPVMASVTLTPEQVKAFGGPEVRTLTPTGAGAAVAPAAEPTTSGPDMTFKDGSKMDGPSMTFADRWNEPGAEGVSKNAGGPSWGLAGKFK